ncbi:M15 family metallopeptidase [Acrocarpospora pleiomorpha]|uniref:M15 family metallopeptidase n=1 Tax=Acrocarpospora pleiomorpha TaxID=90975 RepID=UPI0012D2DE0C|nr:M15 family metallopeptidase [Acrocarpospora pleiomorpha]
MTEIVLLSDPRIARIRVEECGEPLVDLRAVDALRVDPRLADERGAYAHVRLSVADRLVAAQTRLPQGLRLLVVEGLRPRDLRERYFAPHVSGGAVDLTLCTQSGAELPMGTEVNATPPEADEACHTASTAISTQDTANRRLLITAMTATGFVNYPTKWWHWSYGDRYWAFTTGAPYARYGMCEL